MSDAPTPTAESAEAAAPAPRLLLVDDEPGLRTAVQAYLEDEGFDVTTAVDGEEGFAKAKQMLPDVVISDVMMPRLDGYGLLQKLRADERLGGTPVIFPVHVRDRTAGIEGAHIDRQRGAFHSQRLGGGAVDALDIDVQIRCRLLPQAVAAGLRIRRGWLDPIDPDRQGADGGRAFDQHLEISWPRLPHLLQHLLTIETTHGLHKHQPAQAQQSHRQSQTHASAVPNAAP